MEIVIKSSLLKKMVKDERTYKQIFTSYKKQQAKKIIVDMYCYKEENPLVGSLLSSPLLSQVSTQACEV